MIVLDKENRLITLHTQNTTYQMKVWDYNILLHTWYGPRLCLRIDRVRFTTVTSWAYTNLRSVCAGISPICLSRGAAAAAGYPLPILSGDYQALQLYLSAE